ncbi:purine nucleoside permease-domain-containing protein [Xylogone sp. PMI_703]|nr:purine nucleoside permease-domain-containing protein [Xylogone sp. PMI_703]
MRFSTCLGLLAATALVSASPVQETKEGETIVIVKEKVIVVENCAEKIAPKVFIISMFDPEANIWYSNANTKGSIGNLLAKNITVPGLSPLFPQVHCLEDGSVCQLTTGESEINAATTINSLVLSPLFDLTKTYFLIAGIAGINPKHGTIGGVAFSKYAIQVALQYEFDARSIPSNFSTGYVPLGATSPDEYPKNIYGTEVFEVNEALRDIAVAYAKTAKLNDSDTAIAYRANYASAADGAKPAVYAAAIQAPGVYTCDVATSDVYYSGTLLGEAFENTTTLFTNGSATYCMTAQEDNATLEVLLRAALHKTVDFSRIIVMRTASNFDRPYPGLSDIDALFYITSGGFDPSLANIYLAGTPIIKGILKDWEKTFEKGIKPKNYIGDIFGTLGGEPDFGPGSVFGGKAATVEDVEIHLRKRAIARGIGKRSLFMQ